MISPFRLTNLKRCLPWVVFTGLALFILLPLLGKGYVLAVDMVFAPHVTVPATENPNWLFYAALRALNVVLPVWIIQKILLIAIFLLSGAGAFFLARRLFPNLQSASWYAAGVLYAYNPFIYTRLMTGQYEVLLGYALIPSLLICLLRFLARPNSKTMLFFGLLCSLVGTVSIHSLGLAGLLIAVFAGRTVWQNRQNRAVLKKLVAYGGGALLIAGLLSSNWLVPLILGKSQLSSTVDSFTMQDFSAFQPSGEGIGLFGNILTLQGFWADSHNLYLLPRDMYSWWLLPIIGVMAIISYGIIHGFRQQKSLVLALLIACTAAFVLALGTADTMFAPVNKWIIHHVPFAAGYRDSQKFSAILALAYACFFALGSSALLGRLRSKKYAYSGGVVAMGCVLSLWAPLLPWAGRSQLYASDYPRDWYIADEYMQLQPQGKALFLPWHKYMPLSFSGVTTANPAPQFFKTHVVASNNPEIGNARGYSSSDLISWLDEYIHNQAQSDPDFSNKLANHGIGYIVLAKEFDYRRYAYLANKNGLVLVKDTDAITIYRIMKHGQ